MQTSKYISSILPLRDSLCITSSGGIDISDYSKILYTLKIQDFISCTKTNGNSIFYSTCDEFRFIDSNSKFKETASTNAINIPFEITTFDIYDDIIAIGSNLKDQESHISFYDFRNLKEPISVFSDCHSDDITALKFINSQKLLSGSTDGLLNIFNLSTFNEEQDLFQVIKYDSIDKLGFFEGYIWATSHIETLGIWDLNGDEIVDFGDVRTISNLNNILGLDYDFENKRLYLNGNTSDNTWEWYHVGNNVLEKVADFKKHDNFITSSLLVNHGNLFGVTGDDEGYVLMHHY